MIIVVHLMKMKVGCLCGITDMEMKWNAQDKGIFGQRLSREVLDQV
jgi:hypothetical protein